MLVFDCPIGIARLGGMSEPEFVPYEDRFVPEAGPEILYGMECFMQVYPIPVWEEALRRGRAAYGAETGHTKIRNLNQVSTDHVQ